MACGATESIHMSATPPSESKESCRRLPDTDADSVAEPSTSKHLRAEGSPRRRLFHPDQMTLETLHRLASSPTSQHIVIGFLRSAKNPFQDHRVRMGWATPSTEDSDAVLEFQRLPLYDEPDKAPTVISWEEVENGVKLAGRFHNATSKELHQYMQAHVQSDNRDSQVQSPGSSRLSSSLSDDQQFSSDDDSLPFSTRPGSSATSELEPPSDGSDARLETKRKGRELGTTEF